MENRKNTYDIVIVGAGISGATLADRYARVLGKKVLVIERRDHIGGNCYDRTNEAGIRVAKYGPHFFHTNNERVWAYVQGFSRWYPLKADASATWMERRCPFPLTSTP